MSVRSARPEDFAAVTALLEALGRAEVTDETRESCRALYEAQLGDSGAEHLVAEDNGAVVGFCSLHYRPRLNFPTPEAWIPDLFVAEEARERGLGRALLDEAERRARARGCHRLTLESGYQRDAAHRLYARFGMEDAGRFFQKRLV
jgi:GNAT superfamily N-acetyltransferase